MQPSGCSVKASSSTFAVIFFLSLLSTNKRYCETMELNGYDSLKLLAQLDETDLVRELFLFPFWSLKQSPGRNGNQTSRSSKGSSRSGQGVARRGEEGGEAGAAKAEGGEGSG